MLGKDTESTGLRLSLSRRSFLYAGASTLALLSSDTSTTFATTTTQASRQLVDPRQVSYFTNTPGAFALTFDDGPDPRFTPYVLDVLARHEALSTFFIVAANAQAYPHLVEAILKGGHSIANHTHTHAHLDQLSWDQMRRELDIGRETVESFGYHSSLMRPPWGHTSPNVVAWTRQMDQQEVFWNHSLDAAHTKHARATGVFLSQQMAEGDILLAHDGGRIVGRTTNQHNRQPSLDCLDDLLTGMGNRGIHSSTLETLFQMQKPK